MQIREALISQSPSLALQRAAADEIARLDAEVRRLQGYIDDEVAIENAQYQLLLRLEDEHAS